MGVLDSIRRLFGRADKALTDADYAALDAMHGVEDRLDDATGGRFYDGVEKADEEAGELLERLHLDHEPSDAEHEALEPGDTPRPDAPAPPGA